VSLRFVKLRVSFSRQYVSALSRAPASTSLEAKNLLASMLWSLAYLGKRSKFRFSNIFQDSSSNIPETAALSSSIVFSFSRRQVRDETNCPGSSDSL